MIKKTLIYASISVSIFLYAFTDPFSKSRQENQPPVVKIIAPKNNSSFDFDTQLNYEITVADKEDGDSKYDEINTKEVLLEVRYEANKAKVPALLSKGVQSDAAGLAVIRASNCFNCHNFNSKAIGPSFYEISTRYPAIAANIDLLVKRIREGSTGVWGKETMPTHPELTTEETKAAVQWMLKNGADPNVSYYIGLTGSFRIKAPVVPNKKGAYILTASYTDHGLKNAMGKHLKGQDVVVISSR